MKFALGEIRKKAFHEPYQFDDWVDVSELETMNNDIRTIGSVHVSGTANDQGDEIIFNMTISGKMILPCARTLVDVPYPFEIEAVEVFTTSPYTGEDDEEDEIHPINGEVLDLTPYIKENVLLEVPFRVFSDDENSAGQAPMEGNGWELVTEEKNEKKIDPRLKKLESLLDDKKEK